MYASTF